MPYYKLMRIYDNLHDDLKYWWKTGRPIVISVSQPVTADELGPETNPHLKAMSNVDVMMAVKKEKALVVTVNVPKIWFPDPSWHKKPSHLENVGDADV